MSSETYRYYRLGGSGHLAYAKWIEATSNEDAVAQVEAKFPGERSEVWLGSRLVATLSPQQSDGDARGPQGTIGKCVPKFGARSATRSHAEVARKSLRGVSAMG